MRPNIYYTMLSISAKPKLLHNELKMPCESMDQARSHERKRSVT